ncbi:MAG: 50S ribosomal protein L28 [Planctomycetota bacterium]|jgi:large subunit ribosomal protein L28
MSKQCEVCGKGVTFGKKYARRGLEKAKGGAGAKITGKTARTFSPNVQKIRVATDKGGVARMKVCTSCIKAGKVKKAGALNKRKLAPAS